MVLLGQPRKVAAGQAAAALRLFGAFLAAACLNVLVVLSTATRWPVQRAAGWQEEAIRTWQTPVAISVSIDYIDMLTLVVPKNARYFSKWYIVTIASDVPTKKWCESGAPPVVECLFHDDSGGDLFFKGPSRSILDKGRLLAMAQSRAYAQFPGHYYLILDSDILLPDNFGVAMGALPPPSNTSEVLYFMPRFVYSTHWRWKWDFPRDTSGMMMSEGYFQLYAKPVFYQPIKDCLGCMAIQTYCDKVFEKSFLYDARMPQASVCCHLGPIRVNWGGRVSENVTAWGLLPDDLSCTRTWSAWLVYYFQIFWKREKPSTRLVAAPGPGGPGGQIFG